MTTEEFEKKIVDALCKSIQEHPEDWSLSKTEENVIVDQYHTVIRKDGFEIWCSDAELWRPDRYEFQIEFYREKLKNATQKLRKDLFDEKERQKLIKKQAEIAKAQQNIFSNLGINSIQEERKEKLEHLEDVAKDPLRRKTLKEVEREIREERENEEKKEGKVKKFLRKLF